MTSIYYAKLPRQAFDRPHRGWSRSMEKMAHRIESVYAPGYTSEPFVQLVRYDGAQHEVMAEWMPGQEVWVPALMAAGLD